MQCRSFAHFQWEGIQNTVFSLCFQSKTKYIDNSCFLTTRYSLIALFASGSTFSVLFILCLTINRRSWLDGVISDCTAVSSTTICDGLAFDEAPQCLRWSARSCYDLCYERVSGVLCFLMCDTMSRMMFPVMLHTWNGCCYCLMLLNGTYDA